jgi:threonine dehydratase
VTSRARHDTETTTEPVTPVSRDDVAAAHRRIADRIRRTPVLTTAAGELGVDAPLVLKLDLLQHTGSFKARGAASLLTGQDVPAAGVVAASGGNFGLAAAWAARELGHPAHVFVPDSSPAEKIDALARYDADVHVVAGTYQQALDASLAFVAETGGLLAHAYDQPEVVAGQGTCALELSEQAPALDTVVVAVGGGGLVGGVAGWYGDRVRVVAVETEGTPALHAALAAGEPVEVAPGGLCVSSLGASRVGAHGFAAAQRWVDTSLLVTDDAVREAQHRLWEACALVAEPGGATALAALTSGAYVPEPGERVGIVVCGANTDPATVVRG